jgi:hypothetical protein
MGNLHREYTVVRYLFQSIQLTYVTSFAPVLHAGIVKAIAQCVDQACLLSLDAPLLDTPRWLT